MNENSLSKEKTPNWRQMEDEEYAALTDTVFAGAISFVRTEFLPQVPGLSERLENSQVLELASTALHDGTLIQAQAAFSELYADDREMAKEAKITLAALRKIAKQLDKIPQRSAHRFLRNSRYREGIFSQHFHGSLDEAIERFQHWSLGRRGRPSNVGQIVSAGYVVKALEILLDRPFKRDLSVAAGKRKSPKDRSDWSFVSLDARFAETVLRLIDPSTTRSNVKSALQGAFQMENAPKNNDQNDPD